MSLDRFWERVDATGPCWLWTGAISSSGYGNLWVDGKNKLAHRVAWELLVGPAPDELDHLCRVTRCVNPDHLEPVEHIENMRRGTVWGRSNPTCRNGHPYDEANTHISPTGRRRCRTCAREWMRKVRADVA
jgi:hypothetical protein